MKRLLELRVESVRTFSPERRPRPDCLRWSCCLSQFSSLHVAGPGEAQVREGTRAVSDPGGPQPSSSRYCPEGALQVTHKYYITCATEGAPSILPEDCRELDILLQSGEYILS